MNCFIQPSARSSIIKCAELDVVLMVVCTDCPCQSDVYALPSWQLESKDLQKHISGYAGSRQPVFEERLGPYEKASFHLIEELQRRHCGIMCQPYQSGHPPIDAVRPLNDLYRCTVSAKHAALPADSFLKAVSVSICMPGSFARPCNDVGAQDSWQQQPTRIQSTVDRSIASNKLRPSSSL